MTNQSHALAYVPSYPATSPGATGSPLSYLRLGSMISTSAVLAEAADRGDDLLETAGLAGGDAFFVDDSRTSQTQAGTKYFRSDGVSTTGKTRADLTSELLGYGEVLPRGGWRDHTDGNRIITTRGDRVDVVYGNYRRVILGRVAPTEDDDLEEFIKPSFWEISGGHLFDATSTGLAELLSIEWVQDGKTWKVTEETEKGDCIVRYCGRTEDHFNGSSKKEYVGEAGGTPGENPTIESTSYLDKSSEHTEANTIDSSTSADTIVENTTVDDSILETKLGGLGHESSGSGAEPVHQFNDDLYAHTAVNLEVFGAKLGMAFGGVQSSTHGNSVSVNLALGKLELALGASAHYFLGTRVNFRIGQSVKTNIGAELKATAGIGIELNSSKNSLELDGTEIHLTKMVNRLSKNKFCAMTLDKFGFKTKG